MGTRIELQDLLCEIDEVDGHVYFQPPVNLQLYYPCIIYDLEGDTTIHADDRIYNRRKRYTITVIDRNPDSGIPDQVSDLLQVRMDRHFENDHLHHFVYSTIY